MVTASRRWAHAALASALATNAAALSSELLRMEPQMELAPAAAVAGVGLTLFNRSTAPEWMLNVESFTGSCAVVGNCLRSTSLPGSCSVRVDPAKAKPLCATALSTSGKDALLINGKKYKSDNQSVLCNVVPTGDLRWTSTTESSAFNLCWHDEKASTSPPSAARKGDLNLAAVGDPHLVNVFGQRFDLHQVGTHTLLQVPLRAKPGSTLLRVDAEARQLGAKCGDTYFTTLNVTGRWVEANFRSERLHFDAAGDAEASAKARWLRFGKLQMKIARGHTAEGIEYLNFFLKHLSSIGHRAGGLLGEDDHTKVAAPTTACKKKRVSLLTVL